MRFHKACIFLCLLLTLVLLCIPFYAEPISYQALTAYAEEPIYPIPEADSALAIGAKGDEVKWLQTALNEVAKADFVVDGDFGTKTEAPLKLFQAENGLESSGIADEATLTLLEHLMLPEATIETTATEQPTISELPDQTEKPAYVRIRPEVSRDHLFIGYWEFYFVTLKDTLLHFKTTIAPFIDTTTTLGEVGIAILIIFAVICLIPVSVAIIHESENNDPNDDANIVTMAFGSYLAESGDLGCLVSFALRLIGLLILFSPLLCDIYFIKSHFDAGWIKVILDSCLFVIMRILLGLFTSFIIYWLSVFLLLCLVYVIKLIFGFPSWLISVISGERQEYKDLLEAYDDDSYQTFFEEASVSDETSELIIYVSFLPAIISFLLISILPLIMAVWVSKGI